MDINTLRVENNLHIFTTNNSTLSDGQWTL